MTLSSNLIQAFSDHLLGLCGLREPARLVQSLSDAAERLNILTLGVVMDSNPPGGEIWSALTAIHDHWLLQPAQVAYQSSQQVQVSLRGMHIPAPGHIARVWWQICRGVQGRAQGSWQALLEANDDNVHTILGYLQKSRATFPVLSGPVISARWLDLVHRMGGITLQGWESLGVPVSSGQVEAARLFGIVGKQAHPQLLSALYFWSSACRKSPTGSCGLVNCPRRGNG